MVAGGSFLYDAVFDFVEMYEYDYCNPVTRNLDGSTYGWYLQTRYFTGGSPIYAPICGGARRAQCFPIQANTFTSTREPIFE